MKNKILIIGSILIGLILVFTNSMTKQNTNRADLNDIIIKDETNINEEALNIDYNKLFLERDKFIDYSIENDVWVPVFNIDNFILTSMKFIISELNFPKEELIVLYENEDTHSVKFVITYLGSTSEICYSIDINDWT